jgi:ubiquinone/menaquinone biosynthesis C-methylase UbiE
MTQWYEDLFKNYGKKYDQECFVQGTIGECDFIEMEISHNKNLRILDIGCGTGRHSIELTRRGYSVTGLDLSQSMLDQAKRKADQEKLNVRFLQGDARHLPFQNEFDLIIMLCEGAFSLMETDEMNYQILKQIRKTLKGGGKLIFTTLNGLFPLFHSLADFYKSHHLEGNSKDTQPTFDIMTFREHSTVEFTDDNGIQHSIPSTTRYYIPPEITWLLRSTGFEIVEIFGAKLGAYSRNDPLTPDDFEMLVVAS